MRMFLPIKGPGGRYLTTREKIALLILGLTLVLCALTLLAGDGAYVIDGNRNPVSGFVAFLCRTFGGGIVALYALVLVWSGLIYFKGERAVDMRPLAGRMFAALCVTLGISGVDCARPHHQIRIARLGSRPTIRSGSCSSRGPSCP